MFQCLNQRLRHLIIWQVIEFFVFQGDKLLELTDIRFRTVHSFSPSEQTHCMGLHQVQRSRIPTQVAVQGCHHGEVSTAWLVAQKIRVLREVCIKLLQSPHMVSFNKIIGFRGYTPLRVDVLADVLHSFKRQLLRIFFNENRLEVKQQKVEVILVKVPAVVHAGSEEPFGSQRV